MKHESAAVGSISLLRVIQKLILADSSGEIWKHFCPLCLPIGTKDSLTTGVSVQTGVERVHVNIYCRRWRELSVITHYCTAKTNWWINVWSSRWIKLSLKVFSRQNWEEKNLISLHINSLEIHPSPSVIKPLVYRSACELALSRSIFIPTPCTVDCIS